MKKAIAFLLTAAMLMAVLFSACAADSSKANEASDSTATSDSAAASDKVKLSAEDEKIFNAFYDNFLKLAAIPRPSHHEEKISKFLYDWAVEKGYEAYQDDSMNVIFEVPATEGKENTPLVALQAHMDMVAAAKDGVKFDPLNDPIKPIRDDAAGTLTADGTTLGADDGAGVGTIMTYLESGESHGPLRIIFTTNEEDGMSGTFNLDPKWVKDPKYLINVDAVDSSSALVSTASGTLVKGSKNVKIVAPSGNTALEVSIGGLKGGHSGVDIDKGRCNAIIALGSFLKKLSDQNIAYEVASFKGGSAPNAIPGNASCVIVVDKDSKSAVTQAAEKYLSDLQSDYKNSEDGITFTAKDADMPDAVIASDDVTAAVTLVKNIINGIHTMSPDKADLVESSSNLGLFSLSADGNTFTAYERSSVGAKETEIVESETALAEENGFTVTKERAADPWPYNPDNKLAKLA